MRLPIQGLTVFVSFFCLFVCFSFITFIVKVFFGWHTLHCICRWQLMSGFVRFPSMVTICLEDNWTIKFMCLEIQLICDYFDVYSIFILNLYMYLVLIGIKILDQWNFSTINYHIKINYNICFNYLLTYFWYNLPYLLTFTSRFSRQFNKYSCLVNNLFVVLAKISNFPNTLQFHKLIQLVLRRVF